jgi:hypothetical protein
LNFGVARVPRLVRVIDQRELVAKSSRATSSVVSAHNAKHAAPFVPSASRDHRVRR